MLDISKIPRTIVDDLHERGHTDEQIKQMTAQVAFREWLEWHGIIGWAPTIWSAVESFKEAGQVEPAPPERPGGKKKA